MTGRRPKGCLDLRAPLPRSVGAKNVAAAAPQYLLAAPDHRPFRGPRLFQGQAETCFSFATRRSVEITSSIQVAYAMRDSIISPSVRFNYEAARRGVYIGQVPPPLEVIGDVGSYPDVSVEQTALVGMVRERDCPYDPALVNVPCDDVLLSRAYAARGFECYPIHDRGSSLVDAAADAMRRGFSVFDGIWIDQAVEDWSGGDPISYVDPSRRVGGHARTLLYLSPDGQAHFDNWWEDSNDAEGGIMRMTTQAWSDNAIAIFAARYIPSAIF